MSKLYIQDRQTYKVTHREMTEEGFMRVPGRVAKTGTQKYLRRELGLDGNPNEEIIVYRPPEEVFKAESLDTYNVADVSVLHPSKLIDASTYKGVSVGVVSGSGRQDGDFVVCDLVIKDADAIKKVQDGLVELSAGYTAEYFDEKGVAPDGTSYDYVQRDIRINHVALVPSARAGRQARLYDEKPNPKGKTMHKVVLDSGRSVEVQDEAIAALVSESIGRLQATADAAKKEAKDAKDEAERKQAKIDAMEEENEKKKGETSDSVIASRIAEITAVTDKAKEIESAYVADSIDPVAIMRGVLTTARPTVDWAAKSDEYVSAAFDMAHENAKAGVSGKSAAQQRQIAADAANGIQQPTGDAKPTAYSAYAARMTNTQAEKK